MYQLIKKNNVAGSDSNSDMLLIDFSASMTPQTKGESLELLSCLCKSHLV